MGKSLSLGRLGAKGIETVFVGGDGLGGIGEGAGIAGMFGVVVVSEKVRFIESAVAGEFLAFLREHGDLIRDLALGRRLRETTDRINGMARAIFEGEPVLVAVETGDSRSAACAGDGRTGIAVFAPVMSVKMAGAVGVFPNGDMHRNCACACACAHGSSGEFSGAHRIGE